MVSTRAKAVIALGNLFFAILLIWHIYVAWKNADLLSRLSFPLAYSRFWKAGFNEDARLQPKADEVPSITVVTAYYNVPSKRHKKDYIKMMRNFLPHIPCNLYIYTSKADYPLLAELRAPHIQRTKFIVREFEELRGAQRMDVWEGQHKIDPEGSYQSSQVYVVWNEKIHMVMEAIDDNVFHSDYFFWCDVGSFRSPEFTQNLTGFPNPQKTAAILKDHEKMTLLLLESFANSTYKLQLNGLSVQNVEHADHLGAGIMAGHKEAWRIWHKIYYDTQELMLRNGLLAGKEQNVMNNAVVRYPGSFNLVSPPPYFEGKGDQWFYFQYYFS